MDLSAFEVITELPREITQAELLGRRIFVKINSFIPRATTIGEVQDWTNYTIKLPKNIRISFALYSGSGVSYTLNHEKNTLKITVTEDTTPLEARGFIQHVMNEVKNG